jgi:hypothetical protein
MPTKPKIRAADAVRDIRSGMTDLELIEKYGLSARGLQSLIGKLLEVKAITPAEIDQRRESYRDTNVIQGMDEKEFVRDIRSGMSNPQLMKKYGLSSDGLRRLFEILIKANVITLEDLYTKSPLVHDTVFIENMRELPRHYLAMPVEIYESKLPENRVRLSDITEKGIGITGMAVRIGETKTFTIPTFDFIESDPVVFEAECRWAREEKETGEWLAGFEIRRISDECLEDLRTLIKCLPFLD